MLVRFIASQHTLNQLRLQQYTHYSTRELQNIRPITVPRAHIACLARPGCKTTRLLQFSAAVIAALSRQPHDGHSATAALSCLWMVASEVVQVPAATLGGWVPAVTSTIAAHTRVGGGGGREPSGQCQDGEMCLGVVQMGCALLAHLAARGTTGVFDAQVGVAQ